MRRIGVVTVARSDYGALKPILTGIKADPRLMLQLFVGGMHLSPEFGTTIDEIEGDGFRPDEKIEMSLSSQSPEGVAKSMGLGVAGFAQAFQRTRPDLLVLVGDRFEMLSAAVASLPFAIPLAHLHGGESTEGLIDEPIRHSITKMSHLHFVSTRHYGQRVIQMGEEPWRVTVTGAPNLDNLKTMSLADRAELEKRIGMPFVQKPLLVTYHPVTLDHEKTGQRVATLMRALHEMKRPIVFTYPNADTGSRLIIESMKTFVSVHPSSRMVTNLGNRYYFSLMKQAYAMVGNSSSGIIEAATFKLPVLNVGDRQKGRLHGPNVIDVREDQNDILRGIHKVATPAFQSAMRSLKNPYGDGNASAKILRVLRRVPIDKELLWKRFYELPLKGHWK